MRKLIGAVVAAGLTFGMIGAMATEASADPGSVTIKKISNKKVKYNKKATIRPNVKLNGDVKLSSKKITVKQGSKTIAKNRTSVRLKAGKYTVTTTAKFRTSRKVTKYVSRKDLVHEAGALVPMTCEIQTVTPTTETAADYVQHCVGDFDGQLSDASTAAFNPATSTWTLSSGEQVVAAVPQDLVGHIANVDVTTAQALYRTVKVKKTATKWSSVRKKSRTQRLTVKQGKKPTRSDPYPNGECPDWAPIKGNADSMIYHVPSGQYYDVTNAEDCFTTESAARDAGYRKSKR